MTAVATQPSAASALLAAYLAQLAANPLRTKALTSGTLSGLQEITATKLSGMPKSKNPDDFILGINKRVVQMALYGTLNSALVAMVSAKGPMTLGTKKERLGLLQTCVLHDSLCVHSCCSGSIGERITRADGPWYWWGRKGWGFISWVALCLR